MRNCFFRSIPILVALALLSLHAAGLAAQIDEGPPRLRVEGPPPPVAPAVISRDAAGDATVRATRLREPIRLDGVLDEPFYSEVPSISDFIQSLPVEGGEPSERTEVWIGFDDTDIYVSARVWDSAPESEWVANEMRRDTNQLRSERHVRGHVRHLLRPAERRHVLHHPLGGFAEFQITNEGNPEHRLEPGLGRAHGALRRRLDGGDADPVQVAPLPAGREQVWGLQLRRAMRRSNEWNYLHALPLSASGGGTGGAFRVSMYGTLVGIEAPPAEPEPRGEAVRHRGAPTDMSVSPALSNDPDADAGLDVKYGGHAEPHGRLHVQHRLSRRSRSTSSR
jgi:hypothetical protein